MPMRRRLTSAACLAQGWDGLSVSGAKDSGEVPAGRPWFEGHSAVLALPKLGVRRLRLHHIRCLHIRRDAGVGSAFSRRPSARCTSSSRWRHSRSGAHKDGLRGRSRNSRRDRTTSSRDGTPGLTRHCDPCRPAAFRQLTVSFAGGAGSSVFTCPTSRTSSCAGVRRTARSHTFPLSTTTGNAAKPSTGTSARCENVEMALMAPVARTIA